MDGQKVEERRELANDAFAKAQRWAALAATHMEDSESTYERSIAEAEVSRAYSEIAGVAASALDFADGYDTCLRAVAAGLGFELDFIRAKAQVGRERLDRAESNVDLAIERAVVGE